MVILPATTIQERREQFVHLCCNKVIDFMYQEGFDLNDINCYRNDIKHFTMIFMPFHTPSYKDDEGVIYYPKVTLESNWVDDRL